MNTLNREIRPGETVIMQPSAVPPECGDDRRFLCLAGFGLKYTNTGKALIGRWLATNRPASTSAMEIDRAATEQYQQGGQS